MLIKWEDLEAGDKIKFTKEFINYLKKYEPNWYEKHKRIFLSDVCVIDKIIIDKYIISIFIKRYCGISFNITLDGRDADVPPYLSQITFEIIELKED